MGLLFYDASNGVGAFYDVDASGNMTLLREESGWRNSWAQIVPTGFLDASGKHLSLLFYDPTTGVGELYNHDDAGKMNLIKRYSDWQHSWTQIIPGNWGGTRGLLFYDATTGVGEFYSIDAQGNMALLKTNTSWRHSWTLIVPGEWNPPQTGLLFYDDLAGEGAFYNVDNQGTISLIDQQENWRHTWYHNIVPIGLLGTAGTQSLLFYDHLAGEGVFYNADTQGQLSLISQANNWSHSWAQIVPVSDVFKPIPKGDGESLSSYNGLLFYDRAAGVGEFYVVDDQGNMHLIQHHTGWRGTWTIILEVDVHYFGKRPGR